MEGESYADFTVNQLKSKLRNRNLTVSGLKKSLIERLEQSDKNELKPQNDVDAGKAREQLGHRGRSTLSKKRNEMKEIRSRLVLWRKPVSTLHYFALELASEIRKFCDKLAHNRITVAVVGVVLSLAFLVWMMDGPHHKYLEPFQGFVRLCAYWMGLGILSSIGLGTGLHTFLLYLGPHIASVTLSAWECMSVDFPSPPYPDQILCPYDEHKDPELSILTIMSKVRLEAFMWGFGTAIGELPPYFMARAARLSGSSIEEEEIEEELESLETNADLLTRAKRAVLEIVKRIGFLGILLCASIPNPLFDLAGITCGHFLIPFWTFFGATIIGKAVIKMHIQKVFVILLFTKKYVEGLVDLIGYLPVFGEQLQSPFKEYLSKQRQKLHQKPGQSTQAVGSSWITWVYERLVLVMVAYFVLSIVNSMAQSYKKKLDEAELENSVSTDTEDSH